MEVVAPVVLRTIDNSYNRGRGGLEKTYLYMYSKDVVMDMYNVQYTTEEIGRDKNRVM